MVMMVIMILIVCAAAGSVKNTAVMIVRDVVLFILVVARVHSMHRPYHT